MGKHYKQLSIEERALIQDAAAEICRLCPVDAYAVLHSPGDGARSDTER